MEVDRQRNSNDGYKAPVGMYSYSSNNLKLLGECNLVDVCMAELRRQSGVTAQNQTPQPPPQESFVILLKSNEAMNKSEKNYVTTIQGAQGGTSTLTFMFM